VSLPFVTLASIDRELKVLDATLRSQGITECPRATLIVVSDFSILESLSRANSVSDNEQILVELVKLFVTIEPCRLFVLIPKARRLKSPEAVVAAESVQLANGRVSSIEIVEIYYSTEEHGGGGIAQIVEAQAISGGRRRLLVWTSNINVSDVNRFYRLVDEVYFDSQRFPEGLKLTDRAISKDRDIIDLQWLQLAPLRHQTRLAFSFPENSRVLEQLERIEITIPDELEFAMGYLLAGWILDKLDLQPRAIGFSGFECIHNKVSPHRYKLTNDPTILEIRKSGADSGEMSLGFFVDRPSVVASPTPFVFIKQSPHEDGTQRDRIIRLETEVKGKSIPWSVDRFKEDSMTTLLRKYLVIGNSLASYRRAAQLSLSLRQLNQDFTG